MAASTSNSAGQGPLSGLVVVDLSTTLPGAQAGQFFADAGADVIMVEPHGGSPLRSLPGWPGLLRGRRSITLDLHSDADRPTLDGLLAGADVLISTSRPQTAERLGLTPEVLAERYPRLVAARITGWGTTGPWRDYKGYEALVLAKIGVLHEKRQLTLRPGPAYVTAPYASIAAGQAAIHGILAALIERESSGLGQIVDSNLVTAVGSLDPYNWFYEMVLERYPDAFTPMDVAYDEDGRPQAYLIYALLIAATRDGRWLQFAQTAPRLMEAWLAELGLDRVLADPKWEGFPMLPTAELRTEFWKMMLERVGERTLAEWQERFEANPNLSAETYRTPDEALDHPQTVHDGRVATVEDPDLGPVRQPSTLVHSAGRPLTELRAAPRVGEHSHELRARAAAQQASAAGETTADGAGSTDAPDDLPLEGLTVIEFGTMFAGPYGATVLTDLGARVIKIEPTEGDNIRRLVAFPEAGGAKVLQGKESVALDLATEEGLELTYELVKRADIVLQCFRGGVAERAGVDEATLTALNPDLVYLSSPGYGVDGPYAGRPAYAPSIAAAAGLSVIDGRDASLPPGSEAELERGAMTLHAAGAVSAVNSDGISALGVASAMLLGQYAKLRGKSLPGLVTTMLGTVHNALINHTTGYDGRPEQPQCDAEFYGLSALYRLYPASDGWVFLAAPMAREWAALAGALAAHADLAGDPRFATADDRRAHDDELATVLADVFAARPKDTWEMELSSADVGCVAVTEHNSEKVLQWDEYSAAGYSVDAVSPIFDEHRRLAPLSTLSRSRTKADPGCTVGQHTETVLREIGVSDQRIADLADRQVIALAD